MPTARQNIERGLVAIGLADLVSISVCCEDRVFGWPLGSYTVYGSVPRSPLEMHCIRENWMRDPDAIAARHHGAGVRSYREPNGNRPAMQICFHRDGRCEIDYDYSAPVDVVGAIGHWWEVLRNRVTGRKTDQSRVAEMLDKRFPKEGMEKANG